MASRYAYQDRKKGETWTHEQAKSLFEHAVEISKKNVSLIYIGEVRSETNIPHYSFNLCAKKFPDLKYLLEEIRKNCEVNTIRQTKEQAIPTALGIFVLKVQNKWTDSATEYEGQKITVEGVTNEELDDMLGNEDND